MSASNIKGVVHLTAEDVARVINGQPAAGIVIYPNGLVAPIPAGFSIPASRIVHISRKLAKKVVGPDAPDE